MTAAFPAPQAASVPRWSTPPAGHTHGLLPAASSPVATPADTARWRVHLLGGFVLEDAAGPTHPTHPTHRTRLTRLRSRASMALLARLAMAPGRAHARDELAALLWPDAPAQRSRSRLRQTLSLLRAVLEPPGGPQVLQADHWVIRVRPGTLWCDVPAFEAAAAQHDDPAALALYRGELLPGLAEEWLEDERRHLAALAERVHERHRRSAPAAPDRPPAPGERPGARSTRPARCDETVPVTARLPAPADASFGRGDEAAALRRLLAARRLVTVVGPGGIGKTRLVLDALSSSAHGLGPARFVDIGGLRTLHHVLRRLRATLRTPAGPRALDALTTTLDATPGTLVLDGAEALDGPARAWLAAALARMPALRCVITSRLPMGWADEALHPVLPLPLPVVDDATDLAALAAQPAVALFIDRARAVRPEFHLHRGNAGAVVALLHRLDGWPLAIELAAARMHLTNPAMLLSRFAEPPLAAPGQGGTGDVLGDLTRRGPRSAGRQANLLAVLDAGLLMLPPASRHLLQRLACPAGGPPEAAQQAVLRAASATALAPLVDGGWLSPCRHDAGGCRLGHLVRRWVWLRWGAADRGGAETAAGVPISDCRCAAEALCPASD
ncbi:MAG: hypothetical protein H6932_16105 [Burkholderiaceae bacterium]|nr:hypothetical protein [Burkholderiaceae bacterium]